MLLLLSGCGTYVTATQLQRPPRPLVPRSPESVQVLASTPPSEPHVDVALLQVEESTDFRGPELDAMIATLRAEAAAIGCDAIYLLSKAEYYGRDALFDSDSRQMLASCIVFTPPGAPREGQVETAYTRKIPAGRQPE